MCAGYGMMDGPDGTAAHDMHVGSCIRVYELALHTTIGRETLFQGAGAVQTRLVRIKWAKCRLSPWWESCVWCRRLVACSLLPYRLRYFSWP